MSGYAPESEALIEDSALNVVANIWLEKALSLRM